MTDLTWAEGRAAPGITPTGLSGQVKAVLLFRWKKKSEKVVTKIVILLYNDSELGKTLNWFHIILWTH